MLILKNLKRTFKFCGAKSFKDGSNVMNFSKNSVIKEYIKNSRKIENLKNIRKTTIIHK
jgi:hypothetical protein